MYINKEARKRIYKKYFSKQKKLKVVISQTLIKLGRFSISDIERFTGIKAHTLRIWEQRYAMLIPKRTDTNIRFYDDADLRYLLNVSILCNHGYRISEVSKMVQTEIEQQVREMNSAESKHPNHIKALTSSMLSLDEESFNRILNTCILQMGLEQTMMQVVFAFLEHIGILWMTGSIHPAHEHFISNLIKQKLYVAIDGQPTNYTAKTKNIVLYLPEGETHEIGLLFANYVFRNRGHRCIYLGQMTPENDIKNIFDLYKPHFIFTSIISTTCCSDIDGTLCRMIELWKPCPVFIAGSKINDCKKRPPSNVHLVRDFNDMQKMFDIIG